jgi:hypothetical protein
MNSLRARILLEELAKADWFAAAGQPSACSSRIAVGSREFAALPTESVATWTDALEMLTSKRWHGVTLQAFNDFCCGLPYETIGGRNDLAREIRPLVATLVTRKIATGGSEAQTLSEMRPIIESALMGLCVEESYSHQRNQALYPYSCFFGNQGYWFLKGHLPCGWRSNYPDGQLAVL